MRWPATFLCMIMVLIAGCGRTSSALEAEQLRTIDRYVAAYNARQLDDMAALMHPDIQWLSVEGAAVTLVADGKDDLVAQMRDYIASPRATVSSIESSVADGDFIAVREKARWRGEDGAENAQSALAVYQVSDGLVRRVWYYPSSR